MSLSALMEDVAPNCTYFQSLVLMVSFQPHSHVTSSLWITSFHLCPGRGGGTGAPLPMLMMMSSGMMRFFTRPILGCSPRPRNKPGGSTR